MITIINVDGFVAQIDPHIIAHKNRGITFHHIPIWQPGNHGHFEPPEGTELAQFGDGEKPR